MKNKKKGKKDIQAKKKELQQLFLESDTHLNPLIYRLLERDFLDKIIQYIDDEPVPCNVNPEDLTSADEQFLLLLNRLIMYFRRYFPKIYDFTDYAIETIVTGNSILAHNYLLSKHYLGDNDYIDFFNQSIWQLLVSNFLCNGKHVYQVKHLLKSNKIKYSTNIDDYSLDELKKIINLLSDLVYCASSEYRAFYLFGDIDADLCKRLEDIEKEREYTLKDVDFHNKNLEEFYSVQYDIIIEEYMKKRKYLKYFK